MITPGKDKFTRVALQPVSSSTCYYGSHHHELSVLVRLASVLKTKPRAKTLAQPNLTVGSLNSTRTDRPSASPRTSSPSLQSFHTLGKLHLDPGHHRAHCPLPLLAARKLHFRLQVAATDTPPCDLRMNVARGIRSALSCDARSPCS
jgi:hypothetical protein